MFEKCRVERQDEINFVQYYDILPNTEVTAVKVDAKIKFILVNWERHGREKEGHGI